MVALTGVGEAPYRAKAVEAGLIGNEGSDEAVAAAAAHAADGVTVNSDIHADREYRTAMAAVYTRRAIAAALARLSE
jgi:carbon-monoxide dehydrogenase medium subunit